MARCSDTAPGRGPRCWEHPPQHSLFIISSPQRWGETRREDKGTRRCLAALARGKVLLLASFPEPRAFPAAHSSPSKTHHHHLKCKWPQLDRRKCLNVFRQNACNYHACRRHADAIRATGPGVTGPGALARYALEQRPSEQPNCSVAKSFLHTLPGAALLPAQRPRMPLPVAPAATRLVPERGPATQTLPRTSLSHQQSEGDEGPERARRPPRSRGAARSPGTLTPAERSRRRGRWASLGVKHQRTGGFQKSFVPAGALEVAGSVAGRGPVSLERRNTAP